MSADNFSHDATSDQARFRPDSCASNELPWEAPSDDDSAEFFYLADQLERRKRESIRVRFRRERGLTPDPGNTGVTSSQLGQSHLANNDASQTDSGGEDAAELKFYGGWDAECWDGLRAELDRHQERAKEASEVGKPTVELFELPEGDVVGVCPHGSGKVIRCKWSIIAQGIHIGIVDRRSSVASHPCVCVSVMSMSCMAQGLPACLKYVREILSQLGFQEERCGLSRVDPCVDLVGADTAEIYDSFNAGSCILYAKEQHSYKSGRLKTGVSFGKQIMCRVYNKLHEARSNADKLQLLVENRWGGTIPTQAMRVEFQLRGDQLRKRWNIRTIEDWFEKRAEVIEWLTCHWARFTEAFDAENKHHSRAETSPLWKRVQEAFATVYGRNTQPIFRPVRRAPENVKRLMQQAVGCLTTVQALIGRQDVADMGEAGLMRDLFELFQEFLPTIKSDVDEKRKLFAVLKTLRTPDARVAIPF